MFIVSPSLLSGDESSEMVTFSDIREEKPIGSQT